MFDASNWDATPWLTRLSGSPSRSPSLPLGYRAKIIRKTEIIACGMLSSLAIASFCLENWPPAKSSFDPLRSANGVIDVRILDSGLWGFKSHLYQIDVNEGRVLELENKSISSEEFEIPPWRALPGSHTDGGSSRNFPGNTGPSHNFPGSALPNGRYVAISTGDGEHQAYGAGQIPIVVERSSDHSEVFRARFRVAIL
jgi:hypothetical protein